MYATDTKELTELSLESLNGHKHENIINKIKHGIPRISKTILVNVPESIIAKDLFRIQNQFDEVEIGSYPFLQKRKKGVNIVLRSKNKNQIKQAAKEIRNVISSL